MSELQKYEPGEIRENLTERFIEAVREWLGEIGIVAAGDDLSINHFMEAAGIASSYQELDDVAQDEVRDVMKLPVVQSFLEDEGFEFIEQIDQAGHGIDILFKKKERVASTEEEKVLISASKTCLECQNLVSVAEYVPVSMPGKWKVSKGKRFRDWDFGLVTCPHCELAGKRSEVFLFHREFDIIDASVPNTPVRRKKK